MASQRPFDPCAKSIGPPPSERRPRSNRTVSGDSPIILIHTVFQNRFSKKKSSEISPNFRFVGYMPVETKGPGTLKTTRPDARA